MKNYPRPTIKELLGRTGIEKFFQLFFETYTPLDVLSVYGIDSTEIQKFHDVFLDENYGYVPLREGYYIHSSKKRCSDYLIELCEDWDGEDWVYFETKIVYPIASIIELKYIFNWFKLWKSYYDEIYNPLENYRMEEVRTPNLTEVSSGSDSLTSTTKTKTDLTQSGSNDSKTGLFAFNSSGDDSVPTNDGTVDSTVRTTGSENDNYSSTTQGKTDSSTKTNTGTERLERSGNIGVTTSQQMLQSELELRKFDLLNRVFDDIDKVLCLKIY